MSQSPSLAQAVIMAGGTGGHIFPGIAVASELKQRGWQVSWLGSKNGMEEELVAKAGIEIDLISIQGLRGKGIKGWLTLPMTLMRAVNEAKKILARRDPTVVIGFGGFVAGPGGLAAWLTKRVLIIHEQNAIAGMTNKVLAKLARKVFQAFPGAFRQANKVMTCGNPIRQSIVELNKLDSVKTELKKPLKLLVMGGSRGAKVLNTELPELLAPWLKQGQVNITHQSGKDRAVEANQAYRQAEVTKENGVQVVEFIGNMEHALSSADLIICRAGALTVSEIAAAGRAAIFVPYPYAVDDHQTANAHWLVEQQAAICVAEKELNSEHFRQTLATLINEPTRLEAMADNARKAAILDATETIADYCDSIRNQQI